ncbi:MAG TPA: hypothetical protein VFS00_13000, partial [Polyangiaceae bacterium]|nr:hypothetical protein [Polyangiaceae bacterium]
AAGLNDALARHHDELVDDLFDVIERQNARKARSGREIVYMSRDEIAQAMHGVRSVIAEALEGAGDDCRRHFFDTLFPGLRDVGMRFTDVIGLVTLLFVQITRAVVLELPAEQCRDATNWVAEFSLYYTLDVTRVWVPE